MSALEQICYIDLTIRESGSVRLHAVADQVETSERQNKRNMEYMHGLLTHPLKYVRERALGLPDEESMEKYLSGSSSVFKGPDAQSAVIRFHGWARSVVEREVWHPDQKREEGADPVRGSWIQLTLPAFRFEELLGRTLRFGSMAEPMAPPAFRDSWKEEIRRMYEASTREIS